MQSNDPGDARVELTIEGGVAILRTDPHQLVVRPEPPTQLADLYLSALSHSVIKHCFLILHDGAYFDSQGLRALLLLLKVMRGIADGRQRSLSPQLPSASRLFLVNVSEYAMESLTISRLTSLPGLELAQTIEEAFRKIGPSAPHSRVFRKGTVNAWAHNLWRRLVSSISNPRLKPPAC